MSATATERLSLRIAAKRMLTPDICEFDLRPADDRALPGFAPGAHINVDTPGGATRSYSLTNDPAEEHRYVIAVARDAAGRGGSVGMVDRTAVGDPLAVSAPSNAFALRPAKRYLLVAGGIGITPIRPMFHRLRADGADVRLVYLTRSAQETAYLDDFVRDPDAATVHHSADGRGRLDLWPFLAEPDDDTRVYCCGGRPLMDEVRALTMHWRPSVVHFEAFTGVDATDGTALPFRAVWEPTGATVDVPATGTLLDALRAQDIEVPSSCESGTCGTCRLRLLAGEPEHRDLVLTDAERGAFVIPCVSRAATDEPLHLAPTDG
ncbi:PDR/VanB family oxidoreductase [Yinghuangia seranimata]|uniref:PDR/VanB family oxidoreductase n=1 Tax=Yinghuangia seranimata TaxID=408067 RepID=UPI00248CDE6B|nr:PDR/VanB family oxidoreductase [Yinghuangia seranimata]MDI2130852.1 PDR/VanB family oxidoreductase [Yinghuangia seranimata]